LIFFVGSVGVLFPGELLANEGQLLFVLLFHYSLGGHRVVNSVSNQVFIVNSIDRLGSIFAENAETSATA